MGRVSRSPEYYAYLRLPEWRAKRKLVLERAHYRCARCRSRQHLDVHHLTYVRLGHEDFADLIVLCRRCHDIAHGKPVSRFAPGQLRRRIIVGLWLVGAILLLILWSRVNGG